MPFCPNCGAGTSGAACEVCGHKAQLPQPPPALAAGPELPPLEIGAVVGSAFRDAYGVMRRHTQPIVIMTIVAIFFGVLIWNLPSTDTNVPGHLDALNSASGIFFLIVGYYLLAASVRTIDPSFRFTVVRWFATLGWALLAGVLTLLAAVAFIIPAFWVAPKLTLAPYVYLLSLGRSTENPVARSWRITTGHYWTTLGLNVLLAFALIAVTLAIFALAYAFSFIPYIGAAIAVPVVCIGTAWIYQVFYLALTRWTYLLMERDSQADTAVQPVY